LTDLQSVSAGSGKEIRKQSSSRRTSLMQTFKLGSSGNVTPGGEDNFPKISNHAILKIDKSLQSHITQIFSFDLMKHPAFMDGVYAISQKKSTIMFMHVRCLWISWFCLSLLTFLAFYS
jgi:hypothetical protein